MSEEKNSDSLPKLSILICTIEGREYQFAKLVRHLNMQMGSFGVEIRYEKDDKTMRIGVKRQKLLLESKGEYIVFIDDDDWVSDSYIANIFNAMGNDAIGFLIECTFDGKKKCLAKASMKYDWAEDVDGYKYVRSIYHKTPVKRAIALKAGFPDWRFAEDKEYSDRLKPLIKSETIIDEVMYYYNYKSEDHKTKYGFHKDGQ